MLHLLDDVERLKQERRLRQWRNFSTAPNSKSGTWVEVPLLGIVQWTKFYPPADSAHD
jgi:hypothetical protein